MTSWRHYRQFERGEHIVVAVDSAAGGLDYVAAQFVSKTHIDVPLVYQSKQTMTAFTPKLAEMLEKIYDQTGIKPTVAVERANGGSFEMDRLATLNRSGKFEIFKMPRKGNVDVQTSIHLGWDTTSATRPTMLQELKEAIDTKVLVLYDAPTIEELFSFIIAQTSSSWKAQAEQGAHDDLVMSLAIAWQLYQLVPTRKLEQVFIPVPYQPADDVIGV